MQLIYRGFVFSCQPAAIDLPKATNAAAHPMIYRGMDCVYQKPVEVALTIPKAMNWRFSQVCQHVERLVPAQA